MISALLLSSTCFAASEADSLVAKWENQAFGKNFRAKIKMSVDHDGSKRTLEMRVLTEGHEKALVKISYPAKDRDTGNLRINYDLWQYLPNIERVIKIPTSMMLQSWMGSDFTNDDLVKTSSLARDYTHAVVGHEKRNGFDAVKILLTPKPDAPVVWGKVFLWLRMGDAVLLRQEFYSENGELLKLLETGDIQTFGTHTIPTRLTMKSVKKENASTTLIYSDVVFDGKIGPTEFSQENLRKTIRN